MNDKDINAKHDQPASIHGGQAGSSWADRRGVARLVAVTAGVSLVIGIIVGPIIANNHASAATTSTPIATTQPALAAASGAPEHTIAVSGSGLVSVAPDVADVMIGVSIQKPTVKDARAAAATAMTDVLAAVKKDGVAEKDIATVNVSLNPVYDYNNSGVPRLVGYQWSNTVKITVHDLDKLAAVVDDSAAAGATTIQGISFRLDDPTPQQTQARDLAMADARAKANALAKAAGVTITGVATISESSTTPITYYPQYASAMAADKAASTPIQTGTTDVQIQVTVVYLIG